MPENEKPKRRRTKKARPLICWACETTCNPTSFVSLKGSLLFPDGFEALSMPILCESCYKRLRGIVLKYGSDSAFKWLLTSVMHLSDKGVI